MRYFVTSALAVVALAVGWWFLHADSPSDTTSVNEEAAATSEKRSAVDLREYENSRFEFAISYPNTFTAQPEPQNNDGRTFIGSNGGQLTVFAYHNALDETLRDVVNAETGKFASLSDATIGSTTAEIHGTNEAGRDKGVKILFTEEKIAIARFVQPTFTEVRFKEGVMRSFRWLR